MYCFGGKANEDGNICFVWSHSANAIGRQKWTTQVASRYSKGFCEWRPVSRKWTWSQLRAIPGHSTPATTGNSRASNVIRNHMYVDDVLLGADSAEDGPRPVQNTQMGFLPPRVTRRASRILWRLAKGIRRSPQRHGPTWLQRPRDPTWPRSKSVPSKHMWRLCRQKISWITFPN